MPTGAAEVHEKKGERIINELKALCDPPTILLGHNNEKILYVLPYFFVFNNSFCINIFLFVFTSFRLLLGLLLDY